MLGYYASADWDWLWWLTQVDLYGRLPRFPDGTNVGAGVSASVLHAMPYLVLGRIRPDGSGWYTVQGVLRVIPRPDVVIGTGELGHTANAHATLWMPMAAYQRRWGRTTLHWFGGGGVGRGANCEECTVRGKQAVLAGVALEVNVSRP